MSEQNTNPLDRYRGTLDYELANAEMDFTDSLETLMLRRGVNKSELARRIKTSPAYITKILRGSTNFTLETMVKLVRALDGELHVRACAREDQARWFHAIRKDAIYASRTDCIPKPANRTQYRLVDRLVESSEQDYELAAAA
ncbi:MAG: helix-turn-helix transcriptional regulator [Gammaproteobacteria bacterium]|nr:helix-turn-helix transcriptional regulator [Gammaproteobacteria bacterium]